MAAANELYSDKTFTSTMTSTLPTTPNEFKINVKSKETCRQIHQNRVGPHQ